MKNTYSWALPQIFSIRKFRGLKALILVILMLFCVILMEKARQVLRWLERGNLGLRPNYIACELVSLSAHKIKNDQESTLLKRRWEWHWNMYNIMYETSRQSRFEARYWMLGAGALGWPRGWVWGGRREEGSGWGTQVYLWWIHFDIWQN